MTRLQLMKVHALLAAFILPVAIMFMVTGALYTWGIKGGYVNEIHSAPLNIQLNQALQPDLQQLTQLTETELTKLNIDKPSGTPKLKVVSGHFMLEWSGSSINTTLESTDNERVAKLTIKNTDWYRQFVQLHKAKGGEAFKVYAAVFSIALALLLLSGFIMAWQTPKLKRVTVITSLMGTVFFILMIWVS